MLAAIRIRVAWGIGALSLAACSPAIAPTARGQNELQTNAESLKPRDAANPAIGRAQFGPSPPSGASPAEGGPNCRIGKGKTYEVGPEFTNKTLASVPWEQLQPGDTVRVHHRPEPYREKLLLSQSGTAQAPITLCGVADASGNLPVIDGSNATTNPALRFPSSYTEPRGVVVVSLTKEHRWGYKPSHLVIDELDISNGNLSESFVDSQGTKRAYMENAAAVFVERGEHIIVRGCILHGSGNGLFVASSSDEATQSRDILAEGNHIFGNGSTGKNKDRHHNIYTEAIGMIFQFNRLGPLRDGSGGSALKDRSANTVIRYNWIEGGSRSLDLVEPEDSHPQAAKVPHFGDAFVYGNVFIADKQSASRTFHYGGDTGELADYRKGTLYFYNNTVIAAAAESDHYNTTFFQLDTDEQVADVRNNIFYSTGNTHLTWGFEKGIIRLGTNWVNSGILPGRKEFTGKIEHVSGREQTIFGSNPMLRNSGEQDYCLGPSSKALSAAGDLSGAIPEEYRPNIQYAPHQRAAKRKVLGAGDDLGALSCR
jgi:hypothetical protein